MSLPKPRQSDCPTYTHTSITNNGRTTVNIFWDTRVAQAAQDGTLAIEIPMECDVANVYEGCAHVWVALVFAG